MTCLQLDDLSTFQDWPKKGVLFQDVMQIEVLPSCNEMIAAWAEQIDFWMKLHGHQRYALAGVDFRGALFAGQLKMVLKGNHPLLIVRKKGKIPDPVKAVVYKNEYKDDELEVSKSHLAEIPEGMPFVIIDDILATGGTLKGVVQLLTANGRKPEEMFGTFVNDVPALRNVRELNGVEILLHKSKL
jgi:adenine phosphoribosyltransferase